MNRRTALKRTAPLRATAALARKTGLRAVTPLKAKSAPVRTAAKRKPRRDTGFSPATKLLIRTRAGNGSPEQAACEACAVHLGLDGGQVQHIYARGIGGSLAWLYQSAANGTLLCGTPQTGDHGLCEARDPHMFEMGFWRRRNGTEKPGDYPIMLHGKGGGGVLVYLRPAGTYSLRAPEEAA